MPESNKTALITGVSGQDGAYLAQLLLKKGYKVIGSSRDAEANSFGNLKKLEIIDQVQLESMALNDFRSVLSLIVKVNPDEIYNLAGQSSVGLSFQQPVETMESIALGTLNLLEAIRFHGKHIRLYNASSSECFGDIGEAVANEYTAFRPTSPYGVSKAAAFWQVANYREAYGLHATSGILFNHESPLRSERFVTKKIVSEAVRIAKGSREKLELGNIDINRDWGWAPEYVEAIWRMLQEDQPRDLVIATGHTASLTDFIVEVFQTLDLDWKQHVVARTEMMRPTDLLVSRADPTRAFELLGWKAERTMPDIAKLMVEYQLDERDL